MVLYLGIVSAYIIFYCCCLGREGGREDHKLNDFKQPKLIALQLIRLEVNLRLKGIAQRTAALCIFLEALGSAHLFECLWLPVFHGSWHCIFKLSSSACL